MKRERAGAAEAFPVSYAIFQLARTHRAFAGELLRELDLFPGQEIMLMALWEHGDQLQSELVQLLKLDPSTVAKSLRRLEDAGLVTRRTSQEDRRASIVSLTKKGKALESKVDDVWRELERVTVAGLDDEQRALLLRTMEALEANVAGAAAKR
jgi:MarR family transcriptional regulator, organic hydroperoxide resistance regulator